MTDAEKDDFTMYLQRGRDALLWKLEGLSEYDIRRPVVASGTNLLGLVKHVASVEAGYFGEVMGRPLPGSYAWLEDDAEPDSDMWATPDESREFITDFYRRVWAHSAETIAATDLDAEGYVPWWPVERQHPTLRRLLVHMVSETQRHAGHADILRELVDNSVGDRREFASTADTDDARQHRERLEQAAKDAAARAVADA